MEKYNDWEEVARAVVEDMYGDYPYAVRGTTFDVVVIGKYIYYIDIKYNGEIVAFSRCEVEDEEGVTETCMMYIEPYFELQSLIEKLCGEYESDYESEVRETMLMEYDYNRSRL